MKKTVILLLVVFAAVVLFFRLPKPPVPVAPTPPMTQAGTVPNLKPKASKPNTQVIYTVSGGTNADENGLAAKTVKTAASDSPARDALNALCESKSGPLPVGTTLRGVKIDDGLATADFSREFQTHFHGGTTEESQTINSILLTLGQFPSVSRVQILVDGKKIDSLSNLPIDGPLDVIRPNATKTAQGGGA